MKDLSINKKTILERLDIIELSLNKLGNIKVLTRDKFMLDENFAIAEHYLRYALEATFDICAHVLSRIPGVRTDEYAKMAIEMGNHGFVPMDFAKTTLREDGKVP